MRLFKQKQNQTPNNSIDPATSGRTTSQPSVTADRVLQLQSTIGNQAVIRLLQSQQPYSDNLFSGTEGLTSLSNQNSECTFQLVIEGTNYCFNAIADEKKPGNYRLMAAAPDKTGGYTKSIIYSAYISVTLTKNKRKIVKPADSITLTGYKGKNNEPVSIEVDPIELAAAWDVMAPADTAGSKETDKPAWDFVVLVVYDDIQKTLPRQIVYWMGKGDSPAPSEAGKKVAWFEVKRTELNALVGGDYYSQQTKSKIEALKPEQVAKLVAGKPIQRTSVTGFDTGTYVGNEVRRSQVPIKAGGDVLTVPFDVAAGHESPSGTYRRSMDIHTPPEVIQASFQSDESSVPDGIAGVVRQQFKDQIQRVLLYLRDTPNVRIKIYGDTDTAGKNNQSLSNERARNVKDYLTDTKVWTGDPPALTADRIMEVTGRGQTEAEKDLKQKHPNTWKSLIGKDDINFRRFVIEYISQ